ncbi:MAG: glycosyltransferase family 4 protein [Eubacteriales bacterium]
MMKACLIIAHSFSPPHAFTFSIAKILRKNGFNVTIIGAGNRRLPKEDALGNEIRLLRSRSDGIYFSPFISLLNPLTLISLFVKALREKADIYWCHGYGMIPIMLALKILSKRVIYDVGDDDPSNYSYIVRNYFHLGLIATLVEKIFRSIEYFAIKHVDYVICLTETLRKDRLKYNHKSKVIYYCIDPVFNPFNIDKKLAREFKNYTVIIYTGTISPKKGSKEILEAFEIIKKQVPNALLMMVGASSPESNESETEKLFNKTRDVIVTGWLSYIEMPKYIWLAKVGLAIVKPANYSYQISVPFKLLEQMACGLPVIAPKGLPEVERIVRTAECGLLVDANDPSQIADAVIQLLQDEKTRSTMGENARNYILQHHRLEIMEKEFMEICYSVLAGSPRVLKEDAKREGDSC